MKTRNIGIAILLTLSLSGAASAQSYWYNGDFDSANGLISGYRGSNDAALVFDNFRTPPWLGWFRRLKWVVGCYLMRQPPISNLAYVEVRTNMSVGNGGQLRYARYLPMTLAPTGRSAFGIQEFRMSVNITSIVFLQKSRDYWVAVAPGVVDFWQCYQSTTDGLDRPWDGLPVPQGRVPGQSILHCPSQGINYADAGALVGIPGVDFSIGAGW